MSGCFFGVFSISIAQNDGDVPILLILLILISSYDIITRNLLEIFQSEETNEIRMV